MRLNWEKDDPAIRKIKVTWPGGGICFMSVPFWYPRVAIERKVREIAPWVEGPFTVEDE